MEVTEVRVNLENWRVSILKPALPIGNTFCPSKEILIIKRNSVML
jgi:hypothetical protein